LTASTALALNASKEIVSVTNTGTGDNVLATAPTLVGDVSLSTGNLVVSNGKGIDFSLTPGTGTSELLADYEEGTWTPTNANPITVNRATYTKIGRQVFCNFEITVGAGAATVGDMGGLPFAAVGLSGGYVNYHNENATTTYTIYPQASTAWSFRLGSGQQQFSASKFITGVIVYYV
jgi:hypothetical protein